MSGSETIRAIIVDDEKLARQYLVELLKQHPQVEVLAECKNGFDAVKAVSDTLPDLLFLDIQMPKLNGFEVLELLEHPLAVVFVTAYDEYAVKAFDAHAVDYLLKPFSKERLAEAIEKVQRNLNQPRLPGPELKEAARAADNYQKRIVVRDGTSVVIIRDDDIDFIQAEDDYVSIHKRGKSWLKHQTLASLETALDPQRFVRIHRSVIVNVERIARIEPYTKDRYLAILKDDTRLPISRSGHKRIKSILS
jgi:two-component system, LytTR family, response regulator